MITWEEMTIRLVAASVLGGVIGLERERKAWSAGMRTHMMVCLGAALAMLVSSHGFYDILEHPHVSLDPSRVAAQVISGIGFLGAGTIILLKQGIIKGLTTAAGLWTVAAIGLACGGGMYFAAGLTTFISLVILWVLQFFEKKMNRQTAPKQLKIVLFASSDISEILHQLLSSKHIAGLNFYWDHHKNERSIHVHFADPAVRREKLEELMVSIQHSDKVKEVTWETYAIS